MKYLHDLNGWDAIPVEQHEKIIGRTKLSDIELDDSVKPSSAHNALTAKSARASSAPTSAAMPARRVGSS